MFIYVHVYSLSFRLDAPDSDDSTHQLDASDSDDSTHQVSPTWASDNIIADESDCYSQEESTGATYDASRVLRHQWRPTYMTPVEIEAVRFLMVGSFLP